MNTSKLTQKSQEALQEAQSQALRRQHGEVDGEHLLLALLEQPEGVLPRILRRIEGAEQSLRQALEHEMDRRPRVTGAEVYATQRLQKVLLKAEEAAAIADVAEEEAHPVVAGEGVLLFYLGVVGASGLAVHELGQQILKTGSGPFRSVSSELQAVAALDRMGASQDEVLRCTEFAGPKDRRFAFLYLPFTTAPESSSGELRSFRIAAASDPTSENAVGWEQAGELRVEALAEGAPCRSNLRRTTESLLYWNVGAGKLDHDLMGPHPQLCRPKRGLAHGFAADNDIGPWRLTLHNKRWRQSGQLQALLRCLSMNHPGHNSPWPKPRLLEV